MKWSIRGVWMMYFLTVTDSCISCYWSPRFFIVSVAWGSMPPQHGYWKAWVLLLAHVESRVHYIFQGCSLLGLRVIFFLSCWHSRDIKYATRKCLLSICCFGSPKTPVRHTAECLSASWRERPPGARVNLGAVICLMLQDLWGDIGEGATECAQFMVSKFTTETKFSLQAWHSARHR